MKKKILVIFAITLLPIVAIIFTSSILITDNTNTESSEHINNKISDYQVGMNDAYIDITTGKMKFMIFGYPMPTAFIYKDLLKKELNINYCLMGCVVTGDESYYKGYNNTIKEYVAKIYGKNKLNEVWQLAKAIQYSNAK